LSTAFRPADAGNLGEHSVEERGEGRSRFPVELAGRCRAMHDSDWLLIATLLVWLFVEVLASPSGSQSTDAPVDKILSDAIGGNVIHDLSGPFLPRAWHASWWSKDNAPLNSTSATAGEASRNDPQFAASPPGAETAGANGDHCQRSAGLHDARASASNRPRKPGRRADSATSTTLD
jgi:hypothetical protein